MREEECVINQMPTQDIIEYLERYGAESDMPNKLRMMIDVLKRRMADGNSEITEDEEEIPFDSGDGELLSPLDFLMGEGISTAYKLNAIHAYALGVKETSKMFFRLVDDIISCDAEDEDES